MIEVVLTWHEVMTGATIGMRRQISSLMEKRKDGHGADRRNSWSMHIIGALGEMAFCKAFGLYWPASINTFKTEADVGFCEIRTRAEHWYDLPIRKDDFGGPYVLVTCDVDPPVFRVHGWFDAMEARKHTEWYTDQGNGREKAWFVPQSALRPLAELNIKMKAAA